MVEPLRPNPLLKFSPPHTITVPIRFNKNFGDIQNLAPSETQGTKTWETQQPFKELFNVNYWPQMKVNTQSFSSHSVIIKIDRNNFTHILSKA
ncbi:hypothetical protein I79_000066 [Cricetulus griseus]|uniref:Uncharacterized protein n=1 Tax=Cricetulus griseus TaxID=10029 RepID=G3GRC3_CRIGR|nr:hypothetical protein I79_000066 [Cricetulus griseus]